MIYLELFITFFKIGAFTFGGGYAMLPFIQSEVLEHNWLTNEEILNFVAVSESTPGPFAVNISTYVGMTVAGIFGSFSATLGVVLPSFIIILIVAKCYDRFRNSKIVSGCMTGLKPVVIGLIGSALLSMCITVFFPAGFTVTVFNNVSFYISLIIFLITVILAIKKLHPIIIIILSAVLGIITGFIFNLS